jgi:hypothetical protein
MIKSIPLDNDFPNISADIIDAPLSSSKALLPVLSIDRSSNERSIFAPYFAVHLSWQSSGPSIDKLHSQGHIDRFYRSDFAHISNQKRFVHEMHENH